MSVFFVGAMPWVQLFQDSERTMWASVVRADWSHCGTGRFVALRQDDRLRVLGTNEGLARWLWEWLVQPGEAAPVTWEAFEQTEVDLEIDLDTGLTARAGNVQIALSEPIDRQLVRRDEYPLGDFRPTASWVRVPCARAEVVIDGTLVPGQPRRDTDSHGPTSTAQINVAEVWST